MTTNSQNAEAVQGPRVLTDLRRNAEQLDSVLAARYELIGAARDQGITWARIGQALGIRDTSAHRWFNNEPTRRRSRR